MTAQIVVLNSFISKKKECTSLDDFLKRASKLKKEVEENHKGLIIVNKNDLEKIFETRLNCFLLENNLIAVEYFVCAMFIASLLRETGFSVPESWYAVDYFIENQEKADPKLLLDGANVCFLLTTIFTKRCEKRGMKRSDYVSMGTGLYGNFYNQTGKDFAYYMSSLFDEMSDATSECLRAL
jgi:hypothetical protein